DLTEKLFISKKAHLILPTHRLLDAAYEAAKGKDKIGSTLKGIGPTYTDKVSRTGVRVGDIELNFEAKYKAAVDRHKQILDTYNFDYSNLPELEKVWFEGLDVLKRFAFVDSEQVVNTALKEERKVLAEGAQGTMLDIDFGSYPFVTSSNTVSAGACTGLGIAPNRIGEVYGIFKAYCKRVGSGPFPTELFDEMGEELRQKGHEFGSTTGRPRRCGWIDLVALKYAVMINGVTQLIMMKSDVLDQLETIKACVAYRIDGEETETFPYSIEGEVEPVYVELAGWKTDMTKMTDEDEFPEEFNNYLAFLEEELEVPIKIVSVGPDRDQTIIRYND
ncbi:MAG: adenylosuccinate synthase, partial [Bacteroidales bacterium]